MERQRREATRWLFASICLCLFIALPAHALQSTNYRIDEDAISTGNLLQSSSANYQAVDGVNDLAIGNAASTNYQIEAGSKTTGDPWLTFSVDSSGTNFGTFSPTTTATATAAFTVLNYTSYGYVVQIFGSPPTNDGHSLVAMSGGTGTPGTEGFGINLVANTSPISFGADPDNGQFGFGEVDPDYITPNDYRYVDGGIIATAPKSSGLTDYTISAIANVSPLTPGGVYTSAMTLIVTGTY